MATHEKPGCNGTLVDNILTNSTENILISGDLDYGVSHHPPSFAYYSIQPGVAESPKLPSPPQYDYCKSKGGFNKFCNTLDNMIEHNFRTDTSCLTSKRNRLFNPCITSGIIALYILKLTSIENGKKHVLIQIL